MNVTKSGSSADFFPFLVLTAAAVLVGLVCVSIGLFPVRDAGDQWWHLKTGKYLLDAGFDFPEEDVFSWTSEGHRWANHEWLSDTLMYLGYRGLGLRGLIALKAFILVVTFFLVAWLIFRKTRRPWWSLAGALLAAWTSQYSVHLRPPVLTYCLLAVYLHLVWNLLQGYRVRLTHILSFFLMLLWINLHGGAILGLVVAGAFLFGEGVTWGWLKFIRKDDAGAAGQLPLVKRFALNLGILTGTSLLNPFGYHIHLLTFEVMGNKELLRFVAELQPPDLRFTLGYNLMVALLVLSLPILYKRIRLSEALLVLFFLHQSWNHVRHLPLFAIITAPVLFPALADFQERLMKDRRGVRMPLGKGMNKGLPVVVIIGSVLILSVRWPVYNKPFFQTPGYIRTGAPVAACNFILRHPFQGRLYNPINFAGYLIWRLSPEHHQTFTDSRFDIFGSEVMLDCLAIDAANRLGPAEYGSSPEQVQALEEQVEAGQKRQPYWKEALDRYEISFMILGRDSRLHQQLEARPDPGWVLVYEDFGYAIYVRDSEANQPVLESIRS